jgi:hypothetical protein
MSKIIAEKFTDAFNSNFKQVQLRQEVSSAVQTGLGDQLYTAEEIGKTTFTNQRVIWQDVNLAATLEEVQAKLDSFPNAKIVRKMSLHPIMHNGHLAIIKNGLKGEAFEEFKQRHNLDSTEWDNKCRNAFITSVAERQLVRYPEDNTDGKPANSPILFEGRPQYRHLFLDLTGKYDEALLDHRTKDLEEIKAKELKDISLADNPAAGTVTDKVFHNIEEY